MDVLRARAQRARSIRRRVTATALATFVVAFGTIAQTGSLGATTSSATTATTASTPTTTTATNDATDAATAVTTRQS